MKKVQGHNATCPYLQKFIAGECECGGAEHAYNRNREDRYLAGAAKELNRLNLKVRLLRGDIVALRRGLDV